MKLKIIPYQALKRIYQRSQFWHPERQFRLYIDDILAIVKEDRQGKSEAKKILSTITNIILILTFKCFQFIILTILPLDTFWRILNYDIMVFLHSPQKMNVCGISFVAQLIYFYQRGYWFARNSKQATPIILIYRILYSDTHYPEYFLENNKISKNKSTPYWVIIRRYTMIYIRLFQYCILFFCKYYF